MSLPTGVATALAELNKLGRTPMNRRQHALSHFDQSGTSNGSTDATEDLLEHLRDSALGIQKFARSTFKAGGFRPRLHPRL